MPVVYNTRNPLDIFISDLKHLEDRELSSHCDTTECVAKHQNTSITIRHHTSLLRILEHVISLGSAFVAEMDKLNVTYIHIHYEEMFSDSEAVSVASWKDVRSFLGLPSDSFHFEDIQRAMFHQKTSSNHQKDMVKNYDRLVYWLQNTPFEGLLHR